MEMRFELERLQEQYEEVVEAQLARLLQTNEVIARLRAQLENLRNEEMNRE
jgi:hypothetical protein